MALTHDYLTQRGGAERVVLSMLRAFPGAPLYTALYEPATTFAEFESADVRPLLLNRVRLLRRRHRLALPVLARAFERLDSRAAVTLCSTSGWAHGTRACGRKVVYCYTPPRWLHETEQYLGGARPLQRAALRVLRGRLRDWDLRAAASASRYVTSSTAMRDRIRRAYGIDAEVLPPPQTFAPAGREEPVEGLEPGFFLCVSRLLPFKNVGAVAAAAVGLGDRPLVVVGTGPEGTALRRAAPVNVRFVGAVADERLRWLYRSCAGLVAASYEDFGLTPLEAAAFGKPAAVLRYGGFLDTVVEGVTGTFFETPEPTAIRRACERLLEGEWDAPAIRAHAAGFSESRFTARLREIVDEEAGRV